MTNYYLDPDWTGTQSGTQSQPFALFTSGAWSTINAALATGDVTVYLSARAAGSDTDDILSATIDMTNKTPNPTGTLTLNGHSFYNTNDSTPSWSAYSGTSKARVVGVDSQNAGHMKYSKVTIDGLRIMQSGGNKGVAICGDNWTVENSDISHTASATDGPLFLIVPTADGPHEGSSFYCSAMSNITIRNNTIHDSWGELIYVGAGGCNLSVSAALQAALDPSACQGAPSHSNISILNNTLSNCGSRGGQGDCIDMKAALTNVTIRGNDISASINSNDVRVIVTQGVRTDGTNQNLLIERNYIHDHPGVSDAAIALADSWGTPNGVTIRNNIIDTIVSGSAILSYGSQSLGVSIYNNTIYKASGFCITSQGGTYELRNNVCLSNNGDGTQTSLSGTFTSTNNAFSGTWGGTCTSCVAGLSINALTNVAGKDFSVPVGSVLTDRGITLTSFSVDYVGTSRPQGSGWDIGAREFNINSGDMVPPIPPTGLTIN